MDMTYWVPPDLIPELVWLGKIDKWLDYVYRTDEKGGTYHELKPDAPRIISTPGFASKNLLRKCFQAVTTTGNASTLSALEAYSRMLTDGPKVFHPTSEQFESMEHVELHIPPSEFRSPYPVMVVSVPDSCRERLGNEYGFKKATVPQYVLIRDFRESGSIHIVGITMMFKGTEPPSEHIVFSDAKSDTIEIGISKTMDGYPLLNELEFDPVRITIPLARAAMNCCLMLTNYGHKEGGPNNPTDYTKHRSKKHLHHLACRDFTTVEMKQNIVVRVPPPAAQNPPGTGTGIEMRPHWRKGHWRCYPGKAAERAAGVQTPLLFVRPCLVRGDRAVGDIGDSRVNYHG